MTSQENLLAVIDGEIASFRTSDARSGWTRWAVTGALVTIAGLLLTVLEKRQAALANSIAVLVVLVLAAEALHFITNYDSNGSTILHSGQRWKDDRGYAQFVALKSALLIICLFLARVSDIGVIAVAAYAGLMFFSAIFIFAISFTSVPSVEGQPNTWPAIFVRILLAALTCTGIAAYFAEYHQRIFVSHLDSVRAGALLYAATYLLGLLSTPKNDQQIRALLEIRNSMLLGKITYEKAFEQVELHLSGIKFSDAVQAKIVFLLELYRRYEEELAELRRQQDEINETLKGPADRITHDELLKLGSRLDSIFDRLEATTAFEKKIQGHINDLAGWRMVAGLLNVQIDPGFLEILNTLKSMEGRVIAIARDFQTSIKKTRELIDAFKAE